MKTATHEPQVDLVRWEMIQTHFEALRHEPSALWHARLKQQFPADESVIYDVLSLLVANRAAMEDAPTP